MRVRRKLIVGNWKMNGNLAQLGEIAEIAAAAKAAAGVDVALCLPFTLIAPAVARSNGLAIGAQDVHAAESGAHTGAVSAAMLKEVHAQLAIVGHSERRADHGETDAMVRAKAEAAWRAGIIAIICIGETKAERELGSTLDILSRQIAGSVPPTATGHNTVIAYEPVWAIGTGLTPTAADVAEAHAHIRAELKELLSAESARMRILYGGSVKPANAVELLAVNNVDGALVGGASLKSADFLGIAEAYRSI